MAVDGIDRDDANRPSGYSHGQLDLLVDVHHDDGSGRIKAKGLLQHLLGDDKRVKVFRSDRIVSGHLRNLPTHSFLPVRALRNYCKYRLVRPSLAARLMRMLARTAPKIAPTRT
jgi:hypothetical protein